MQFENQDSAKFASNPVCSATMKEGQYQPRREDDVRVFDNLERVCRRQKTSATRNYMTIVVLREGLFPRCHGCGSRMEPQDAHASRQDGVLLTSLIN